MTTTTIERAFELARSGRVQSMEELRNALRQERLDNVDQHTAGTLIQRQLKDLIRSSNRRA
jgi:hypothetical protein